MRFKFELGEEVKDELTGFKGIVVRCTQWYNNCNTYGVQPKKLKDGVPQESQNFDELQLSSVSKKKADTHVPRKTGGPQRKIPQANRE